MRKFFLFFVILSVLTGLATAQEPASDQVIGIQGGAFVQKGEKPELAYSLVTDISVEAVPLVNQLVKKVESSIIYSERSQPEANTAEIYGARIFTVQQYPLYKTLYCGIGAGYYYLFNSSGGDEDYLSGRLELGVKINNAVEIYLGADVLKTHTTMIYPHISISLL